MADPVQNISVGVAGWSYPDWNGIVYPPRTRDKLQFLAGYLDMIEINNTFYRPPEAAHSAAWTRRVSSLPGFYFTAKLHQEVTHEGVITRETAKAFHEGLEPMTEAGRLRHLLAQFRYDFADGPKTRAHLQAVRDVFGDVAGIVLELRHVSWETPGAQAFLQTLGVSVANLDYPVGRDSFNLQECRIGRDGYLRLHGRNRDAWFSKDSGRDQTYNYLYSQREVRDIAARAVSLASSFRSLTIVANNHYEGKEVVNALQIKAQVTGKKVKIPPLLPRRYPELKSISSDEGAMGIHETGTLF